MYIFYSLFPLSCPQMIWLVLVKDCYLYTKRVSAEMTFKLLCALIWNTVTFLEQFAPQQMRENGGRGNSGHSSVVNVKLHYPLTQQRIQVDVCTLLTSLPLLHCSLCVCGNICGSLPGTFCGRVSHHHTFSDFPKFTKIISKAVCEEETERHRF